MIVKVTLEFDDTDGDFTEEQHKKLIINDLETELRTCWHHPEIKTIEFYANEMVKPTKCPCGELFDAKDSSFCPKCGCAYGELSGRYTNIGR